MRVWLTLAEAAAAAGRSERTIRNWVEAKTLKPPILGRFNRDDVLAAERVMRSRRGRPRKVQSIEEDGPAELPHRHKEEDRF